MHNVAIIGFGKMGKIRKEGIGSLPDCSLKWVCDVMPQEGDFRFTKDPEVIFKDKEVDMSGEPWKRRLLSVPHSKMDADPEVWITVEQLILSEKDDTRPGVFAEERVVVADTEPRSQFQKFFLKVRN